MTNLESSNLIFGYFLGTQLLTTQILHSEVPLDWMFFLVFLKYDSNDLFKFSHPLYENYVCIEFPLMLCSKRFPDVLMNGFPD